MIEGHKMNRWLRLFKHRWVDDDDVRRALGKGALERLQARVVASEAQHSGEIRLCVEAGLPFSYLWRGATPRDRAISLFGKLRVWDTEANNGVLIYLLLAEHAIEVVADRGLACHVDSGYWEGLMVGMRDAFRDGRFEAGVMDAIATVEELLMQHFPLAAGASNPNELPDAPAIS